MSGPHERVVVDDLFAAAFDGIALLDGDEHRRVNETYARTFGADAPEDLVGVDWDRLYDDAATARIRAAIDGAGEGPRSLADGSGIEGPTDQSEAESTRGGSGADDGGDADGSGCSDAAGTVTLPAVRCVRLDDGPVFADLSVRSTPAGAVVVVRELADGDETLAALHDPIREIQAARTVDEVCERTLAAVREGLGWPRVACWEYDADDGVLRPRSTDGGDRPTLGPGDPEFAAFEGGEPAELPIDGTWTGGIDGFTDGIAIPIGDRGLLGAASTVGRDGVRRAVEPLNVLGTHVETALDRVERERERRRSERRYRTLAEHVPGVVVALFERTGDGGLRYLRASGPGFDEVELVPEDLEGNRFDEVHDDRFLRAVVPECQAVFDGETRTFEFTYADRVYEGRAMPVADDDGEIVSGMAMSLDVTEQHERERELRRKERQYRTLAENFPDGAVALFDHDLRYTLVEGTIFERIGREEKSGEGELITEYHSEGFLDDHRSKFEAALQGTASTFQYTARDRIFRAHTVPVEDDDGAVIAGMAMSQDVTEQVERERELERQKRRYRTLAEHIPDSAVTLFDHDLRYTLVAGSVFDRINQDPTTTEGKHVTEFHSEQFVEDNLSKFEAALDGETSSFEFTSHGRVFRATVLPVENDGEVISGMTMTQEITDQIERERELERQRDELETINRINGLLLNITRALSDAPSREEVEQIVCERLAESKLYRFAWIGEHVSGDEVIVPRTTAGVEDGYLEEVSFSTRTALADLGPSDEAVRTGTIQVVHDVREDDRFEPWREAAEARGYRSLAVVPFAHGDVVYGLLTVYSARPDAFSENEQSAFATLGETIGFVINALENRRLLVADSSTELTFEVGDRDSLIASSSKRLDATVSLDGYSKTDGDAWIVYASVEGAAPSSLCEAFLEDSDFEETWVIEERANGGSIGGRLLDPQFHRTVLAAGATLRSATAKAGTLRIVVEVPGNTEVRSVVDRLRGLYPDIELIARNERDRPVQTAAEFRESLESQLTERQLTSLRAAYYAGYFEWPRDSTAEDVADTMDITSATLHNHLRKGQKRLLSLFFENAADGSAMTHE